MDEQHTSFLEEQKIENKTLLCQCDMTFTPWTQRCVRQADHILLVGLAKGQTTISEVM
jgi:lysophospholipid hydrolase